MRPCIQIMDAKHSFSIKTPKDLLLKLEREKARFIEASSFDNKEHKFQYDHAINFAYTAWHMVDWIWKYLEGKNLDVRGITGCSKFQEFHSMVREGCFGLQICYEIATGSKHFQADRIKNPVVKGTEEEIYETDGVTSPIVKPIVRPVVRPVVKKHHAEIRVHIEGRGSLRFTEVCEEVHLYWRKFLQAAAF